MSRALLAFIVAATGVSVIAHHKPATKTHALPVTLITEPTPPSPKPVRASRSHPHRHLAPVGVWADTTMYCATGNRNAAGRWPELGDVAVMDRSIPFGTRVVIDGNVYTVRDWVGWGSDFDIYGGDTGCEQRALDYGRRRLRVVVLP